MCAAVLTEGKPMFDYKYSHSGDYRYEKGTQSIKNVKIS
jgi:hypothetical protein